MNSVEAMLSQRIKNLEPYVPGEQPQDKTYIKLNTNENPYPPSPRIEAFLNTFNPEELRRYPDPASYELRNALASRYGVQKEQIFVGNGSDEVLSFSFFAFFDSTNGPLLFPAFTYSFYPVYCDFYRIDFERVPLGDNFSIDMPGFYHRPKSCGVILANPNAPTGIFEPLDKIKRLLDHYSKDRVVVIDEAYIDFGGESAVGLIDDYPNLVVVRTLSKGMSLAGLRLGFAMGHQALMDALFRAKDAFNSYPVDTLAQKIGKIAIVDIQYYETLTGKIEENRAFLSDALEKLGWDVLPSKANFIFTRKQGLDGRDIYLKLKERGILVRHFNVEGIRDFVRISIGTKADLDTLLEEVKRAFP